MKRLLVVLAVSTVALSACDAQRAYDSTKVGQFAGVVEVRWVGADTFLFVPDEKDPFRFTAPDGKVIQPQPIYTDGGSIPRIFWSVPGYSPWALGPAYVIHDWLFMAHHCQTQGYTATTFEDSARIMAEAIKTLMEAGKVHKDVPLFASVVAAVKTPFAQNIWKSENACDLPPRAYAYGTAGEASAVAKEETAVLQKDLAKIAGEGVATVSAARKRELDDKAMLLRSKVDSTQRLATAVAARAANAPATTTLLRIDVGKMPTRNPQ
jgi:hypothetical protein